MALISALFTPIIWALAGVAIGKAFLQMALQFGWVAAGSGTEAVLGAAFDGVFYFLPFFLALTAAKHFKVNLYVALAVVSALLYPQIAELAAAPGSTAFGLPFPSMSYASSVIPAIVAVWSTGYVEHWCQRVLAGALRNFLTPVLVVLVMVPLVLFTVGPVTMWLSHAVADGVNTLFDVAPWLAGALMGGLWQVFVLFGLHWGFVPVFLNDIASSGWEPLLAPVMAAVMAQAAATLAVLTVTRSMDRQGLAAARFITHMWYFFARVAQEGQWHDGGSALAQTLEQSYPEAVACAGKLAAVLELRLGVELSSDERAYLALHVARL